MDDVYLDTDINHAPVIELFWRHNRPSLRQTDAILCEKIFSQNRIGSWHVGIHDTVLEAEAAARTLEEILPDILVETGRTLNQEGLVLCQYPHQKKANMIHVVDFRESHASDEDSHVVCSWEHDHATFLKIRNERYRLQARMHDPRIARLVDLISETLKDAASLQVFQRRIADIPRADIAIDTVNIDFVKDVIEDMSENSDISLPDDRTLHDIITEEIRQWPATGDMIGTVVATRIAQSDKLDNPEN